MNSGFVLVNFTAFQGVLLSSNHAYLPFALIYYVTFFKFSSLLDDLGHEVDMTDSRLQQTLQKIEKVLRLSDGEIFLRRFFYFLNDQLYLVL